MKKFMTMLLVLALLVASALPMAARADVIFEPRDSFYERHREECTYINRNFRSNGVRTVTVYESPESDKVEAFYRTGDRIYISYTYEDSYGNLWGCCENWDSEISGWVPMAYLEVIYDGISFEEEFGDQFRDEQGSIGGDYLGKTIYFWEYPGSIGYIDMELGTDPDGYLPEYREIYVDEDGRRWGRCSYYMGIKGYWLQMDDPTADFDTLFPDYVEETVPETGPEPVVAEIVPKKPAAVQIVKVIVSAAVVLTVVVTAVLLWQMKRKKA